MVGTAVSMQELQHWQQDWQNDLIKMESLADEVKESANGGTPRPAVVISEALRRELSEWQERQSQNADDVAPDSIELLRAAREKVVSSDQLGAAADLQQAAQQQRAHVEKQFQKRFAVAGLSMLYGQGKMEADGIARKTSRLWLKLLRMNSDYRRGAVASRRMITALEAMGDAYMNAGDAGEEVDLEKHAEKMGSS